MVFGEVIFREAGEREYASTTLVFDAHVQCLDYRDAYTFIGVAKHSGKRHTYQSFAAYSR